jgi:hypothetical protein
MTKPVRKFSFKYPMHHRKMAVSRAHDILKEIYPARILQKKANEKGAQMHLEILLESLETLDGLDDHIDMRETLN